MSNWHRFEVLPYLGRRSVLLIYLLLSSSSSHCDNTLYKAWWRHQMETFSALLAICAGNSPVSGEFPAQRPVTRSFDVFVDVRVIKRLSKHWRGWWFETLSHPLWRHRNDGMAFYGLPFTDVNASIINDTPAVVSDLSTSLQSHLTSNQCLGRYRSIFRTLVSRLLCKTLDSPLSFPSPIVCWDIKNWTAYSKRYRYVYDLFDFIDLFIYLLIYLFVYVS